MFIPSSVQFIISQNSLWIFWCSVWFPQASSWHLLQKICFLYAGCWWVSFLEISPKKIQTLDFRIIIQSPWERCWLTSGSLQDTWLSYGVYDSIVKRKPKMPPKTPNRRGKIKFWGKIYQNLMYIILWVKKNKPVTSSWITSKAQLKWLLSYKLAGQL